MGEADFFKYMSKKVSTLKLINVVNKDKNETKHLCGTVIVWNCSSNSYVSDA